MAAPLTAVVLAAGKGTRMKSDRAKVLHELAGKPLAAFAVERALELSADRIVVVVGHQADAVEGKLRSIFAESPLSFALQAEQLGTGHAVMCAEKAQPDAFASGSVVVLSGDVPLMTRATLEALVAARASSGALVSLVTTTPASPRGYGRIVRDAAGRLTRIVEEKDATEVERAITEVNAGIYCFDAAFLAQSLGRLTPKNAQGEYYLTDVVRFAAEAGEGKVATTSAPFVETAGINDRVELAAAEDALLSLIRTGHMKSGVTLRSPETIRIDASVTIGQDTELGPQVALHGKTKVGRNVRIGQGCILVDSTIGDGVELKPYSHLEGAIVGDRCIIGPFARLRPATELAEEVHIGNFVETKKARIGKGSKANHLAYLGDSVIGAKCNVGAGTITCNYDGVHKHETRLGDGVFIGSDTQLVAPVTLGDGAYVGAGSTITKDVPADALAFSRSPQTVKEGWAARRRAAQAAKKNS